MVDALARSPDLVSYMPSTFSTTYDEQDANDPSLGPVLKFIRGGWDRAKEKGVGLTVLYNGIFDNYFFEYGLVHFLEGNRPFHLQLFLPLFQYW